MGARAPLASSRRQVQRAATRRELLEAAARLFAQHGYDGVSLDAVAKDAGFSKGAVYWNFASKQELLASLLEYSCEQQVRQVRTLLSSPLSSDERIRQLGALYFPSGKQNRQRCLLFVELWIQAMRDPALRPRLANLFATTRESIVEMIEQEAEKLDLTLAAPARELAAGVLALGDGLMLQYLADPSRLASQSYISVLQALFKPIRRRGLSVQRNGANQPSETGGRP